MNIYIQRKRQRNLVVIRYVVIGISQGWQVNIPKYTTGWYNKSIRLDNNDQEPGEMEDPPFMILELQRGCKQPQVSFLTQLSSSYSSGFGGEYMRPGSRRYIINYIVHE